MSETESRIAHCAGVAVGAVYVHWSGQGWASVAAIVFGAVVVQFVLSPAVAAIWRRARP